MRIDHVIVGARRIGPVRDWLRDRYGFGLLEGSPHSDGTQGWLVPFATPDVQYLEILTVGDEARLAATGFGAGFLDRTAAGPSYLNWAVLSDDIAKEADRLGELTGAAPGLLRGESRRADGTASPWAEAGFELSWARPWRPFFLEYGNPAGRAARVPRDLARAGHATPPLAYRRVAVHAAPAAVAAWLGRDDLPVVAAPGAGGIAAVTVATDAGDVELVLP